MNLTNIILALIAGMLFGLATTVHKVIDNQAEVVDILARIVEIL